ncbi:LuxR C-terminal-related transcriptional regulator [Lentzea sp. BCCO 10_0856]|uniref:LuxR C-terminal-related transcriptional regulator n=1 Tax=Lentzea miocenica TaxID=3095431 RepID=A0ABU4SSQ1_9PSEU|nr:LuxR C-terminal-related transcriptional regulator [Lentzea sp. BCCO 10_0856]MDX8028888.1 LuxR C-terminal-related transcriptional regulator [Lentzea sp. BCCO 10_0856]
MSLVGRERERERLAAVVASGGALQIVGEPGVGKSALLSCLDGHLVVGVEAERDLPYAGLHQVLHPFLDLSTLSGVRRGALEVVFGLSEGVAPPVHLVGLAALELLSEAGRVVLVDDAQWLDRASQDVLGFVARRLTGAALVATARAAVFAGVPTLSLEPLTAHDADALLASVAPDLDAQRRAWVLGQAAGNPLALTELPFGGNTLEETFAARASTLPADVRAALLRAALGGSAADLELAVEARLVDRNGAFRHPLIRSAVVRAASAAELREAHEALAAATDQPDRRAWHLAGAVRGSDEKVACLLEKTADRALRRGGAAAAVSALERAARLGDGRERARRLLRAAELAAEAGSRDDVERILLDVHGLDLTPRERALVTWLPTAFDDGVGEGAAGPSELVGLAEAVVGDGDVELGMRIFWSVAMRCFWVEPGAAVRERIAGVARRLPIDPQDPRMLAMTAYVCPVEQGDAVVAGLRAIRGDRGAVSTGPRGVQGDGADVSVGPRGVGGGDDVAAPTVHGAKPAGADRRAETCSEPDADDPDDPATFRLLGSAALQVGAFEESVRFSLAAQRGLRAQGQFGLLTRALAVEAWSRTRLGDIAAAEPAAAEAARLAEETGQPYMRGLAAAVLAEIAALRGDYELAAGRAAEAERIGLAAGARPVLATVQLARSLAALGEGRYGDAFAAVRRVHDPADPAYQLALRRYVLPELVEAATRSGNSDDAGKIVEELDTATSSPALASGLRYARALLAEDGHAEALFMAALDNRSSPWERARTQLAFGAWLRRQRKTTQARPHLKAAKEAFEAFGTKDWAERAGEELRASGESRSGNGELTEHELTIARMASDGLTNKEIGERLHLSHRTVSTHLHRIFPKLGVAARTDLKQALLTYDDTVT